MNLHVKSLFSAWRIVGCYKIPPHSAAWISSDIENASIKTTEEVWRYNEILTLYESQKNYCISKTNTWLQYSLQMRCMVRSVLKKRFSGAQKSSRNSVSFFFLTAWRDAGRMKEHHFPRWSQISSLPSSETKAVKMPVMPSCSPRTSQLYFCST